MAVRFTGIFGATDPYLRRTGVGTIATGPALSGCGWVKRKVDNGNFSTAAYFHRVGDWEIWGPECDATGDVAMGFFIDGGAELDLTGPTLTIDTWFFFAWSRDNTNRQIYYGTEAGGTLTKVTEATARSLAGNTLDELYLGNDIYAEPFNGEMAYYRLWETKLSDAEFDAEWRSTTPVRATNLRGDWRLVDSATAGTDSSGNTMTLTKSATGVSDGGTNPTPPATSTAVPPPRLFLFAEARRKAWRPRG